MQKNTRNESKNRSTAYFFVAHHLAGDLMKNMLCTTKNRSKIVEK